MLIAALSGRSLAQAARRAGYRPLVADLFGDMDTRQASEAVEVVGGSLARGLPRLALHAALDRLAARRAPLGLLWGAGFESSPRLLSSLAARWPLIGNEPGLVGLLKDPFEFAKLCTAHSVAHPEIRLARPSDPAGWLIKRKGGSGGAHIRLATAPRRRGRADYYQRRVDGEAVSITFVSNGRQFAVMGFTRQWADPTPKAPFRYGGVVRIREEDASFAGEMRRVVERLSALGLKGLNSADFLVASDRCWLLEINPRPGASLDVLGDREGAMMEAHVEACRGRLRSTPPALDSFAAAAVVYATTMVESTPAVSWPDWTADRQPPGTRVSMGAPLCTVLGEASSTEGARKVVVERAAEMRAILQDSPR